MISSSRAALLQIRQFLGFAFLSGLGWLCDFASFTLLVKLLGMRGFAANFISSYVGVTFVWFSSLKTVFGRTGSGRRRFLFSYWSYQLVSILGYSQLLQLVIGGLHTPGVPIWLGSETDIAAKIIITPLNLVTNYLFMKFLTGFMQQAKPAQS